MVSILCLSLFILWLVFCEWFTWLIYFFPLTFILFRFMLVYIRFSQTVGVWSYTTKSLMHYVNNMRQNSEQKQETRNEYIFIIINRINYQDEHQFYMYLFKESNIHSIHESQFNFLILPMISYFLLPKKVPI